MNPWFWGARPPAASQKAEMKKRRKPKPVRGGDGIIKVISFLLGSGGAVMACIASAGLVQGVHVGWWTWMVLACGALCIAMGYLLAVCADQLDQLVKGTSSQCPSK